MKTARNDAQAIRGMMNLVNAWLALLCVHFLIWQPLRMALATATAMSALSIRGLPLALLLVARLLVTGVGVAAGIGLAGRRAGSPGLAQIALVLSAATDLFVYSTSIFPNNRMPGDTPFYVAASLAYHAAWILYLRHSRRITEII